MGYEDVLRSLKVKDNLFVGNSISGNGLINTPGAVWYVDNSHSASGGGRSWDSAFITLAEAVTAASAWDTILIAPYTIQTIAAAGITITKQGLRIVGANTHPGEQNSALKIAAGTAPMFTIKADRVEISNLTLSQRTAYPCIQIGDTAGQAYYDVYIHDCNFDGYGTATFGIAPGPTANAYNDQCDAVNLVVDSCYFKGHVTAAIVSNGTRDTYVKNTISVPADGIGISVIKAAGARDYTVIADNYLMGISATGTTGIKFAASPTAGHLILTKNYCCGTWNTSITDVGGGCNNYVTDASGGALINC